MPDTRLARLSASYGLSTSISPVIERNARMVDVAAILAFLETAAAFAEAASAIYEVLGEMGIISTSHSRTLRLRSRRSIRSLMS